MPVVQHGDDVLDTAEAIWSHNDVAVPAIPQAAESAAAETPPALEAMPSKTAREPKVPTLPLPADTDLDELD